jgi:pimeloyl-ACP methyl ester carboxylesterase
MGTHYVGRPVRPITEHLETLDGQPVFWRSAEADPGAAPALYVHGVPTSSSDFTGFLAAGGGMAVDLPGFGRSGKRADGDFTIAGYDRFVEAFLDLVGVERVSLCVHDWGGAALAFAQRCPERIERVAIINAVPLLPGYRWHRVARAWRTRGLGELLMGATNRPVLWLLSREANVTPGPLPKALRDDALAHLDQGTQRAILRLYRTSPEDVLAAAGARLGSLDCPALVVWGDRDPYIPARFADDYAAALGGPTEVLHLPDAGHWPWLDRPDVVGRVTKFLAGAA